MPEELCQVSPKSHYVSLALHSDPSPLPVKLARKIKIHQALANEKGSDAQRNLICFTRTPLKFLSSIYSGQPAGRLCQSLWITTVCNNNKKMISSLLSATAALIFRLEHVPSLLWFPFWACKQFFRLEHILTLIFFILQHLLVLWGGNQWRINLCSNCSFPQLQL